MSRKRFKVEGYGRHFGKQDLDRVGYFHDTPTERFDVYRGTPVKFRENCEKGRQLFAGPPSNFFEKRFLRIFYGEALYEPWRIEAKERLLREKRKIGGTMLPSSPAKNHATPGDWYGCFEKISYFSPGVREVRKKKRYPVLPNAKIKPNPRGGPGYANICLNPYPEHSNEPYDVPKDVQKKKRSYVFLTASAPLEFFPPHPYKDPEPGRTYIPPVEYPYKVIGPGRLYVPFPKKPGGNHSGGFSKFPSYASDPYVPAKEAKRVEGVFVLGGPPSRSKYTNSIVEQVTRISCNTKNYMCYRPQVYPYNG